MPSKDLKDQAIQSALANNWQQACLLNQELLKSTPNDIDTLNRLAFSLLKLGEFQKAKSMYRKVIDLDHTNPIALKNLKKLEIISKQKGAVKNGVPADLTFSENVFIEEAGKTKTVELRNITDQKTLSFLQPGDFVTLVIKRSKIFIQTADKKYIGMLPDHIGMRLVTFIKGGNEYKACLKSISEKNVIVFIKETKRMKRFQNQPSFSLITQYSNLSKNE